MQTRDLPRADADLVLYLNNDVVLAAGCLRAAIHRISSRPDAGAVGGRIVRTHGLLQEAGCIVWRDGSTRMATCGDRPADSPEAGFVREVDFCSGAFLLSYTKLARQLGGFSSDFSPAYYEDVDFCTRLRQAGYVILYDPDVLLQHYEYGSSNADRATGYILDARRTFNQLHSSFLRFQYNYRGTEYVRARDSHRDKPTDPVRRGPHPAPHPGLGLR